MFIIHTKWFEKEQPLYVIPVENGDFVDLGPKDNAKGFNTKDEAVHYLERHGLLADNFDIEQVELFGIWKLL